MKKIIFILGIVSLLSACGDSEQAVKITHSIKYINDYVNETKVTASSIVDEVVVENIIVNRGNCQHDERKQLPANLKFGQSVSIFLYKPCEIAQVDVVTNKGSWTVNY